MTTRAAAFAALLMLAAAAAILHAMGRPPICTCGAVELWVSAADSPTTSQMIADWYSPSHIVHGLLFYALLWLLARRRPVTERFLAALVIEMAWELVENTPWAIERYREATIAIGYNGDSVLNTMSDIAMMALGFLLARKLPLWGAIAVGIALELAALAAIRDNLTLNVWMLVAPNETIRSWQAGA